MNDDGLSGAIGAPLDRTDGPQKTTGAARYAAEFAPDNVCHGVMVLSTIPHGRVVDLDTSRAQHAPGVLFVLTHRNAPKLPEHGRAAVKPPAGRVLSLLQDDVVHYDRQPIAVVVADTLERATAAAALVRASYAAQPAIIEFAAARSNAYKPKEAGRKAPDVQWGDPEAGDRAAEVRVDVMCSTPMQITIRWSRTRRSPIGKATA